MTWLMTFAYILVRLFPLFSVIYHFHFSYISGTRQHHVAHVLCLHISHTSVSRVSYTSVSCGFMCQVRLMRYLVNKTEGIHAIRVKVMI